jgi:hypothetical protein
VIIKNLKVWFNFKKVRENLGLLWALPKDLVIFGLMASVNFSCGQPTDCQEEGSLTQRGVLIVIKLRNP